MSTGELSTKPNHLQERAFHNAQAFLDELASCIQEAKQTIDLNIYIFENDMIGKRFYSLLLEAARKGVKCRLNVDGFGSKNWIEDLNPGTLPKNIEIRVFHPLPLFSWFSIFSFFRHFYSFFSHINRRDHKKLALIDQKNVFISSVNLTEEVLKQRESGVKINYAIDECLKYFELTWEKSNELSRLQKYNFKFSKPYRKLFKTQYIRNNFNRASRKYHNRRFFDSIENAKKRVWLVTPYFVPTKDFMNALTRASKNNVDMKILLPAQPDIPMMKYVAYQYYEDLMNLGIEIFEYKKEILHAKFSFIDEQIIVGSSNYDYRSFFTNLEVDLFLQTQSCKQDFTKQFENDLKHSRQITHKPNRPSLFYEIQARIFIFLESIT